MLFKILDDEACNQLFTDSQVWRKSSENVMLIYSFGKRRQCLFSYIFDNTDLHPSSYWWECHCLGKWKSHCFIRSLENSQEAILRLQKRLGSWQEEITLLWRRWSVGGIFWKPCSNHSWFCFGLQKHLQIVHWAEHLIKTITIFLMLQIFSRLVDFRRQPSHNVILLGKDGRILNLEKLE